MFWDLLIVFGLIWIYQSFLGFLQSVYMKKAYHELDKVGTIYNGKDGRFLNNRMIVFAAIDSSGRIAGAKLLKTSRIIIPPKLMPFEDIIGKNILDMDLCQQEYSDRMYRAINDLAVNYKK